MVVILHTSAVDHADNLVFGHIVNLNDRHLLIFFQQYLLCCRLKNSDEKNTII